MDLLFYFFLYFFLSYCSLSVDIVWLTCYNQKNYTSVLNQIKVKIYNPLDLKIIFV